MCGQHKVRASTKDNTGQNTDEVHTPNPRTEIKILDPAGNRTRAAGLEGRNSTDHATATDQDIVKFRKSQNLSWLGHIQRMDENRFPKRIFQGKVCNRRR